MSAHVKTSVPAEIRAGDTINWLLTEPGYPAGDGWSLSFVLINAAGKIEFSSVGEGDKHGVLVASSVTSDYATGAYRWQCRASNGTETYTIREGSISVLSDFAEVSTLDARSHAEKTLAAIESWIEGRNLAVAEYEIAGRKMKYIPIAELLKLRDQYKREVRGQSGKSGRIYLRF
jgi:hypothetical protein